MRGRSFAPAPSCAFGRLVTLVSLFFALCTRSHTVGTPFGMPPVQRRPSVPTLLSPYVPPDPPRPGWEAMCPCGLVGLAAGRVPAPTRAAVFGDLPQRRRGPNAVDPAGSRDTVAVAIRKETNVSYDVEKFMAGELIPDAPQLRGLAGFIDRRHETEHLLRQRQARRGAEMDIIR